MCGYYGNHVKVAGEFNSTVETGRDRERRNMKEYGGKKMQFPRDLVFLDLGSKQPHRNWESKTTDSDKGSDK